MRKKFVTLCLMLAMPCMITGCKKDTDPVTETSSEAMTTIEDSADQEDAQDMQETAEDEATEETSSNIDEILNSASVSAVYDANKMRGILSSEQKISSTTECYNGEDTLRYSYTTETSAEGDTVSSRTKMIIGEDEDDATYYELTNKNGMPILYCSCSEYTYTEILNPKQFESVLQGNLVQNESNITDKGASLQDEAVIVDSEIPSDYGKTEVLYYVSPENLRLLAVNYSFYDVDDDYSGYMVTNYTYGDEASSDLATAFPALSDSDTFTLHVTYEPGTDDEDVIDYKLPMGTELKVYDALVNLVYTDAECTNQIAIEDIDTNQSQASVYIKATD